MKVPFSDFIQKMSPAPSKCLSERINWIIAIIPHRISKILIQIGLNYLPKTGGQVPLYPLFVYGSIWGSNLICPLLCSGVLWRFIRLCPPFYPLFVYSTIWGSNVTCPLLCSGVLWRFIRLTLSWFKNGRCNWNTDCSPAKQIDML